MGVFKDIDIFIEEAIAKEVEPLVNTRRILLKHEIGLFIAGKRKYEDLTDIGKEVVAKWEQYEREVNECRS